MIRNACRDDVVKLRGDYARLREATINGILSAAAVNNLQLEREAEAAGAIFDSRGGKHSATLCNRVQKVELGLD